MLRFDTMGHDDVDPGRQHETMQSVSSKSEREGIASEKCNVINLYRKKIEYSHCILMSMNISEQSTTLKNNFTFLEGSFACISAMTYYATISIIIQLQRYSFQTSCSLGLHYYDWLSTRHDRRRTNEAADPSSRHEPFWSIVLQFCGWDEDCIVVVFFSLGRHRNEVYWRIGAWEVT